jgi:ribosomal protein S18 acetylase RimI-like enzyme
MVVECIRKQYGCKDVYTSVDDSNAHALYLYIKFGFERTELMDAEERVYVLHGK